MNDDPLRPFIVGVWMDQIVDRAGDEPLPFYGAMLGRHVAYARSYECAYRTVIYETKIMEMKYVIGCEFSSELTPNRYNWSGVSPDIDGLQPIYSGWLIALAGVGLVPEAKWQDFKGELSEAFKASVAGAYKDANLSI